MLTKDSAEIINITARADSNSLYHTMFEEAEVAMVVLDNELRIKECNKKFLDFIGYSPEELWMMTLVDLTHPNDRSLTSKMLEAEKKTGKAFRIEKRFVCKDGHIRWGEVNSMLFPLASGGESLSFATIVDINEKNKSEEALRKAKEEAFQQRERPECIEIADLMATSFAHELNQPLSAIESYAQASLQRLENDADNIVKVRELLDKIRNQARRAGDIIEHLRAMVKKNNTRNVIVDVDELFNETMRLAETELSSCGCRIKMISGHESHLIEADKIQIQQVILNLIHNASDSVCNLKEEEKKLIAIQSSLNKKNEVEVSVVDNGKGVPDSAIENLFKPFFTTKETGMGIGLSICQTIIEAHGGKIWYSPNPAGGAIFHFSLPVKSAKV